MSSFESRMERCHRSAQKNGAPTDTAGQLQTCTVCYLNTATINAAIDCLVLRTINLTHQQPRSYIYDDNAHVTGDKQCFFLTTVCAYSLGQHSRHVPSSSVPRLFEVAALRVK